MAEQVLPLQYLERLLLTQAVAVVAVILLLLAVQAALAEVEMAVVLVVVLAEPVEQLTQVAAAAERQKALGIQAALLLAVQALSFFATPAQFNISLVAQ